MLLASCYQTALDLAREKGVETIAFPCISTGVYRFPKERAARIALGHVLGFLKSSATPRRVTFCCFAESDADIYRRLIAAPGSWMGTVRR